MFTHDLVYAVPQAGEQTLSASTTLGKIVAEVRSGQRVLDIGCGGGRLAKHLTAMGAEVVGVERQPEAAALARRYCSRVIEKDLEDAHLLEPGERFDVIVFADVLEHLVYPDAVLRKLAAHLTPTGFVLVSLPNIAYYKVRFRLLAGRFEYEPSGIMDHSHLRFFTYETAMQLVRAGGLTPSFVGAVYSVPVGRLSRFWPTMHARVGSLAPKFFATQWVLRGISQ